MAMEVNDHEEARRQRMEENKKRMQELGLLDFVEGLRPEKSDKPGSKSTKQKMSAPHQAAGLASRRSARTASKPAVDYKDSKEVDRYIGASAADIAVMEAVDEAFTKLGNPAFVRHVLYTYGAGSSHSYIPMDFRCRYMPETDEWFALEDEDQMEWSVLFDAMSGYLRKGWNAFSSHHALMAGDCCLFELVSRSRFRVQIFRYDQHDGGSSRRRMGSNAKRVLGKEQLNEKMSSKRKSTVPEDVDLDEPIDTKPKLEAESLEDHRSADRREERLAIPIDRKPKVKAEPLEDYQYATREAHLSIPIDRKPKLEVEKLENFRSADPGEARLSSPIPARMPIPKGASWTLDNPD